MYIDTLVERAIAEVRRFSPDSEDLKIITDALAENEAFDFLEILYPDLSATGFRFSPALHADFLEWLANFNHPENDWREIEFRKHLITDGPAPVAA